MSEQGTVKGTRRLHTANSPVNALDHFVAQKIADTVNTAEAVMIGKAEQPGAAGPAGRASATPLVCQTDGYGKALTPAPLHGLPAHRMQAGKAAIIMDPQPGDKGIAVFMKRDSSGVGTDTSAPVPPGSFRGFDQADGYLITGFHGPAPELWLELNPVSGAITLSTKAAQIKIECRQSGNISITTASGDISLQASGTLSLTAPSITLDGNVTVTGALRENNVRLSTHTHPNTAPPNPGT